MVMWSHHAIWFTWEVMAHMTTLCGIEKCITMVYHPHSNGLTQHINHSINEKKGKAVAHNQHKWLDLVAVLVLVLRHIQPLSKSTFAMCVE